jgi:hypothetical protein
VGVTAQRLTNDFEIGTELQRDRADDGAVARVTALAARFVILQEDFCRPAIGEM